MEPNWRAELPAYVTEGLRILNDRHFEAFVAGGCVRDSLLGRTPEDWDLCTSARPEEIISCFSEYPVIDTGIRHGTVTVLMGDDRTENRNKLEITTYRIDGSYLDGRHPCRVEFTDRLRQDLARRDFTVNAMAYHPQTDLVDFFEGRRHLEEKKLVCVGDPMKRFAEDSLRILRGLRFAAVLGFELDRAAAQAMERQADLMKRLSGERISAELTKLLMGSAADSVLERYESLLALAAPGFRAAKVEHLPKIPVVRLAAVFPEDTQRCLEQLRYSKDTIQKASALARLFKSEPPQDPVHVRKLMASEGEEITEMYLSAVGEKELFRQVKDSGVCWNLRQLAVNGDDLLDMGVRPGHRVGETLQQLLTLVMEERLENNKQGLLDYVRRSDVR